MTENDPSTAGDDAVDTPATPSNTDPAVTPPTTDNDAESPAGDVDTRSPFEQARDRAQAALNAWFAGDDKDQAGAELADATAELIEQAEDAIVAAADHVAPDQEVDATAPAQDVTSTEAPMKVALPEEAPAPGSE